VWEASIVKPIRCFTDSLLLLARWPSHVTESHVISRRDLIGRMMKSLSRSGLLRFDPVPGRVTSLVVDEGQVPRQRRKKESERGGGGWGGGEGEIANEPRRARTRDSARRNHKARAARAVRADAQDSAFRVDALLRARRRCSVLYVFSPYLLLSLFLPTPRLSAARLVPGLYSAARILVGRSLERLSAMPARLPAKARGEGAPPASRAIRSCRREGGRETRYGREHEIAGRHARLSLLLN